jgi:alpha-galactosidase
MIWQPFDGDHAGPVQVRTPLLDVEVSAPVECDARSTQTDTGVVEIVVRPTAPALVRVAWRVPCVDTVAYWTPDSNEHRGLPPFWRRPRTVSLAKGAPVGCLIGVDDKTVCAFGVAEVVKPVQIRAGVVEETGEFGFWVEHEADPDSGLRLRLDLSGRHFARALQDIAALWPASWPARPEIPGTARIPVYSTWYAMQQHVNASKVEKQVALAAPLGCGALIVDDGWHSTDRGRGYGYVGDWEPSPGSFPDVNAHVARVREHGLAYMLWYALPFAGRRSTLWDRVKDHLLVFKEHMNAGVVDPRYPYVRRLLVRRLSRAVNEWGMDGLKVDFIDQFAVEDPPAPGPGADCATVTEGVHRLMRQLDEALPRDTLIELRQPYVSPGLWPYATMIRASDCPLSPVHNRQRIVDLRLIAGPLAVHGDMMMWRPEENPERVAVQLLSVLFAVPQISVDLTAQTPEVLATLRFWLRFCNEHAEVLQCGTFEVSRPDLMYPLVRATSGKLTIAGLYGPVPVDFDPSRKLLVANADEPCVVLRTQQPSTADIVVQDCRGTVVAKRRIEFGEGLHPLTVPTGGLLTVKS